MVKLRIFPALAGLMLAVLQTVPAGAAPDLVQLETEDGVVLQARFFRPQGELRTAAVLLHQPGRSSADWEYLGGRLAEMGVASLAPDLRGHGASVETSGGEPIDREIFVADDFRNMSLDVAASIAYLRDERALGEKGVQLVGADVGGSAALMCSVEDPAIDSLAILSPGLMYDGVDIVGQVAAYGQRPLLMVVSVEDGYSAKSADVLRREAKGFFHLETYYGVGHGTKMLNREPGLEPLLISWLLGTFQTPEGISLAERARLVSQDRGTGATGLDELAAEERARAERDQETAEGGEASQQSAEDEEDEPRRWD